MKKRALGTAASRRGKQKEECARNRKGKIRKKKKSDPMKAKGDSSKRDIIFVKYFREVTT